MSVVSMLFGCKCMQNVIGSKENRKPQKENVMPEGRLLRMQYSYSGMRLEYFSDYDLSRVLDDGSCKLSFRFRGNEVSFDAPDSLFDIARRIIEEEKMYQYGSFYGLSPEMESGLLDGYSWRFSAEFEGNQSLSSSGRHVSPEGKGLDKIKMLLFEAANDCIKKAGMMENN